MSLQREGGGARRRWPRKRGRSGRRSKNSRGQHDLVGICIYSSDNYIIYRNHQTTVPILGIQAACRSSYHPLSTPTNPSRMYVLNAEDHSIPPSVPVPHLRALHPLDLLLELEDAVHERLGGGRAAGHVDVDGDDPGARFNRHFRDVLHLTSP